MDFSETRFAQEVHRLRRTLPTAAVGNDLVGGIEYVNAPWKFAQRDEMSIQIANLVFVGFAHIQDEEIVAAVQTLLQFARRDFGNLQIALGLLFAADTAEFVVVDQLVNGAIRAAHRAAVIFAQFQFAEFHRQRVEEHQAPLERIAAAKNQ